MYLFKESLILDSNKTDKFIFLFFFFPFFKSLIEVIVVWFQIISEDLIIFVKNREILLSCTLLHSISNHI